MDMQKKDQGANAANGRYLLVPRTLCFIFSHGRVLLMKGAPNKKLWSNLYNGIGGHIERGEDVSSAAWREILEETGLRVKNLRLEGTIVIDTQPNYGIGIYVFSAEAESQALTPSSEGMLEWFDINSLPQTGLVDDVPLLLDWITKKKPGDPPFSARYHFNDNDRLEIELG